MDKIQDPAAAETARITDSPAVAAATACSAVVGHRITTQADNLGRELTTEEVILILASDVYAHKNWHNLGSSETALVAMLERAGYLTKTSQGFTGRPSLPNDVALAPPPQRPASKKDVPGG